MNDFKMHILLDSVFENQVKKKKKSVSLLIAQ